MISIKYTFEYLLEINIIVIYFIIFLIKYNNNVSHQVKYQEFVVESPHLTLQ